MAGKPRRRKKVRTASQRAALRKAQLASARKRRRRTVKKAVVRGAGVAGSFAGAALSYHLGNYARHPTKAKKDFNNTKKFIRRYKKRNTVNLGMPAFPKKRDVGYGARYL